MIGLDLRASAKLTILRIITPEVLQLHRESSVGFDLSYFSFFNENFVHLGLFFFTFCIFFKICYLRINKPYMPTNIIDISNFRMGLHTLLAQVVSF